eukprot:s1966_g8.t1
MAGTHRQVNISRKTITTNDTSLPSRLLVAHHVAEWRSGAAPQNVESQRKPRGRQESHASTCREKANVSPGPTSGTAACCLPVATEAKAEGSRSGG